MTDQTLGGTSFRTDRTKKLTFRTSLFHIFFTFNRQDRRFDLLTLQDQQFELLQSHESSSQKLMRSVKMWWGVWEKKQMSVSRKKNKKMWCSHVSCDWKLQRFQFIKDRKMIQDQLSELMIIITLEIHSTMTSFNFFQKIKPCPWPKNYFNLFGVIFVFIFFFFFSFSSFSSFLHRSACLPFSFSHKKQRILSIFKT